VGAAHFNYMNLITWKSVFLLFPLILASLSAQAQFLGQQSLSESSYVIDQSGQLWAWGDNFYGQLGVGDRTNRSTPTLIPVPAGASKWLLVAGGQNFAVAVADSDKLYAWGLNDKGQIGTGVGDGLYAVPTRIPNPLYVTNWKWVSAGAAHGEALTTDGRLFAWGDNTQGELGVGTTDFMITPQQVQFPTGVIAWEDVAAGPGYTMMISQNGLLYGCGKDSLGTFLPWEGPVPAQIDTVRAFSPLPCIAASYLIESRIESGPSDYNNLYISPNGSSPETMAAVVAGGDHTVFLTMNGNVITTGDNTYGQLGVGAGANVQTGTVEFPTGVTQFVAVSAGLRHSLAIGNDGWLYAWGDNSMGEIGIGAVQNQNEPVKVLKVCPPLAMSANFTAPDSFITPFSVSLAVKNTSPGSVLTNANAFMLLGSPLFLDSVPDEMMPSPIPSNASSSVAWGGNATPPLYTLNASSPYFAYIRAEGSAPLLISGLANVVAQPWRVCDSVIVFDSLSGAPLRGTELVFLGPPDANCSGAAWSSSPLDADRQFTDSNGFFSLCFHGPIYTNGTGPSFGNTVRNEPFFAMRENYRTAGFAPVEPTNQLFTFLLGPSDIQGTFSFSTLPFIGDSIVKVYYPDSLIGYALSRRVIFRTLDSGIQWSAMYEAEADLHDLKFLDPAHGYVVGDSGEIWSTTDSGETWLIARVGTQNLHALSIVDADTAWAVGDSGTLLEKVGNTWSAIPALSNNNLTAIHFFDPEHGVVGGNGAYYLYASGTWVPATINANIRAVYYVAPNQIWFAGTNGNILDYNPFACDTVTADSTYTTRAVNSLYFLNLNIGYALGDSGASFVTYNGGITWANMSDFIHTATSVNFFSLRGHGVSDNGVLNYDGSPSPIAAIVRGRLTFGNPPEPIMGAEVYRYYVSDTVTSIIDSTYTSEQGNFVLTGIDSVFPYEYIINFTDSGIAKTKTFSNITGKLHEITTLNYNDYMAPSPDTTANVNASTSAMLSLEVSASESFARIIYSIPSDGSVRLILQDVLGRTVKMIADGFQAQGSAEEDVPLDKLAAGAYYITLESGDGSLTKKLMVFP
jgi:Regulator of chromosome condensation (RCC1) repeat